MSQEFKEIDGSDWQEDDVELVLDQIADNGTKKLDPEVLARWVESLSNREHNGGGPEDSVDAAAEQFDEVNDKMSGMNLDEGDGGVCYGDQVNDTEMRD